MIIITSLFRIVNPTLWITLGAMYICSVIAFGICWAIQHLAGGVCDVVDHMFGWIHHSARLTALANLDRGVCDPYKDLSMMGRYFLAKMFDFPNCREIKFYETITLTRLFVADPLTAVGTCIDFQQDLCAGVVGGQTISKFVFQHGVYIYFIVYVFSPTVLPLLGLVLKISKKVIHKAKKLLNKRHKH